MLLFFVLPLEGYDRFTAMVSRTLDLDKIPWNSMELEVLLYKFHGIPWNHKCCSNVVQKVPWNFGESSMGLFDQNKFQ